MVGQKFGRLTVLHKEEGRFWRCLCECGREHSVRKHDLIKDSGTKSCGCLFKEISTKHGLSRLKLYKVWHSMIRRCEPDSHCAIDYSKRGISVCEEWKTDPVAFITWANNHGYEEGLQIDRRDNDLGYSPDNCRFVTTLVNQHNTRLLQRNNKTGYTGVSYSKTRGKFEAVVSTISINEGSNIHMGRFDTPWEACRARNEFIIKHNLPHRIQEERC